jgi:hypothetical protein
MTLDFRDGVSILKLVIYTPYFFASLYVCFKMGFMKGSGWIYLSIFCLLRIVGSSAQLASISSHSTTTYTIAAVCDAVGLTPLFLASLGLISRAYYSILNSPVKGMLFSMTVLRIPQIVTTVAGILCIVGATSVNNIQDFTKESTVHIGVILYVVSYIILFILTIIAAAVYVKQRSGERALILAVGAALPFLLVRILYTLIACFAHNASSFNLVTGSVAINLVMAVLEEIIVVAIYTITGIKQEVVPKEQQQQSPANRMAYRAGRGDFGTGKLGLFSLAMAGINELANFGKERAAPEDEKNTNTYPGPSISTPAPGYTQRPSRRDGAAMC